MPCMVKGPSLFPTPHDPSEHSWGSLGGPWHSSLDLSIESSEVRGSVSVGLAPRFHEHYLRDIHSQYKRAKIMFFFLVVWGPHLTVIQNYYWLCVQKSFWKSQRTKGMLGIKSWSTAYKSSPLFTVLFAHYVWQVQSLDFNGRNPII